MFIDDDDHIQSFLVIMTTAPEKAQVFSVWTGKEDEVYPCKRKTGPIVFRPRRQGI